MDVATLPLAAVAPLPRPPWRAPGSGPMSEPRATHGREVHGGPAIAQRHDELAGLVADGRRTDDNQTCSLVLLRKTGGDWHLYPHGVDKFGVRLSGQEARRVAQAILGGDQLATTSPHVGIRYRSPAVNAMSQRPPTSVMHSWRCCSGKPSGRSTKRPTTSGWTSHPPTT